MNALILAGLLMTAQAAPEPQPVDSPDITITGQRLAETDAALRACIARHCSTDKDIEATLAHAENLLAEGRYEDARTVLIASLDRNKKMDKAYPVPVSDLWRANGKVAAHLGMDTAYIASTMEIYDALKAGLPKGDERLYGARMEIAEMLGKTRDHVAAVEAYQRIAADARRHGRPDIAAMAELRAVVRHYAPALREKKIRPIAESTDPRLHSVMLEARLALINIVASEGRTAEAQQMVKALAGLDFGRPVLIYAPPFALLDQQLDSPVDILRDATVADRPGDSKGAIHLTNAGMYSSTKQIAPNFEDMWIDVGFWITPEGRVSDLKILKRKGEDVWTAPLLESIRGRLYTPGNGQAIDSYRMERYTYTAGRQAQTGSHLQGRSMDARVEYLDLSTGSGLTSRD
ncbi:MAG: hypothetical protein ACJ8ER_00770 [Allosphingosinicella sp.]